MVGSVRMALLAVSASVLVACARTVGGNGHVDRGGSDQVSSMRFHTTIQSHDVAVLSSRFPLAPSLDRAAVVVVSVHFEDQPHLCTHEDATATYRHGGIPISDAALLDKFLHVSCGTGPMNTTSMSPSATAVVRAAVTQSARHGQEARVGLRVPAGALGWSAPPSKLGRSTPYSLVYAGKRVAELCSLAMSPIQLNCETAHQLSEDRDNSWADLTCDHVDHRLAVRAASLGLPHDAFAGALSGTRRWWVGNHDCTRTALMSQVAGNLTSSPVRLGESVTAVNVTAHPRATETDFAPWLAELSESAEESGPEAFVEVAMKDFLRAGCPGLKDILMPIVESVTSPVMDQFMSLAGSYLESGMDLALGKATMAESPDDISECLRLSLTRNLTTIVVPRLTERLTAELAPLLTGSLAPGVSSMIMSRVRYKTHAVASTAASAEIVRRVVGRVFQRLELSLPVPLTPALTQSLSRSLALSLSTILAPHGFPKVTPFRDQKSCEVCWAVKRSGSPACAACYQQTVSYYEMYYSQYYASVYSDYYAKYYGDAVKAFAIDRAPKLLPYTDGKPPQPPLPNEGDEAGHGEGGR